jgi:hypothetical protein
LGPLPSKAVCPGRGWRSKRRQGTTGRGDCPYQLPAGRPADAAPDKSSVRLQAGETLRCRRQYTLQWHASRRQCRCRPLPWADNSQSAADRRGPLAAANSCSKFPLSSGFRYPSKPKPLRLPNPFRTSWGRRSRAGSGQEPDRRRCNREELRRVSESWR